MIAEANGLDRDCVLVGNGGDELLFDMALAWGGPGRKFLNMPPTFSVYQNNAELTNTEVVDIPRRADYTIDEEAVLSRVARGDIDYVIVTSPNNPTGDLADERFILRLLDATDALVLVDEAYFEFSRATVRPLLSTHENLAILRTFSKAFSLAGVRVGYILGDAEVVREFVKVRQPYSGGRRLAGHRARGLPQPGEVRARHHADRLGARAHVPASSRSCQASRRTPRTPTTSCSAQKARGRFGSSSTTAASSCATSAVRPCCRIACASPSAVPRRTTFLDALREILSK